jgi:hypothetical protein
MYGPVGIVITNEEVGGAWKKTVSTLLKIMSSLP